MSVLRHHSFKFVLLLNYFVTVIITVASICGRIWYITNGKLLLNYYKSVCFLLLLLLFKFIFIATLFSLYKLFDLWIQITSFYCWRRYSHGHLLNLPLSILLPLIILYMTNFSCYVFEKDVLGTEKGIASDHCMRWFHHKCNQLSDFDFMYLRFMK